MSDMYVECLVKGKDSLLLKVLRYVFIILTVLLALVGFVLGALLVLGLAVISALLAYITGMYSDLEYEYLYLDRELTVDKVMAKTNRKRVAVYSVDRMEVLAPQGSYHLDDFKNRDVKVSDFSSGEQEAKHFVMYYEGGQKIVFTPTEEMVKAIKSVSPRKVFID